MNFLAHAYLSFNRPALLVGNMISDFVKGKKKFEFASDIQKGIMLHREIDSFTDAHIATKEARKFLQPAVGLYSGAFIDVAYDHFLANDLNEFSDSSLYQHALDTYDILDRYEEVLPSRFKSMLPYMRKQNWLYNYRTISGTESSFSGVVRRASYLHCSDEVFALFIKNYASLQECYSVFFPLIKAFSISQIERMADQ